MTTSTTVTSEPADGAQYAALPSDPLAAYALGMMHMLQRVRASICGNVVDCETIQESDAVAEQVLAFLGDAHVPMCEKHALLSAIEHASDIADVRDALQGHEHPIEAPEHVEATPAANQRGAQGDDDRPGHHDGEHAIAIPEALGCAICCDELMLKPVSLLCGHSFCKRCLDMWLKSCANCPSCRQPVARTTLCSSTTSINVALHDVMAALFADKLREMENRDQMERLDTLRGLIARSIETGTPVRELVAQQAQQLYQDGEHDPQADVAYVLEHDSALQEKVLAAEIRERLRKERALREASRRRHIVAYCSALPAASSSHIRMMAAPHAAIPPVPRPIPSVQSNRPVKKYVPPQPQKKSAFFGNLLRRMHHQSSSSGN